MGFSLQTCLPENATAATEHSGGMRAVSPIRTFVCCAWQRQVTESIGRFERRLYYRTSAKVAV